MTVYLNVKQWNRFVEKIGEKFSTDESLSSSEEVALLEFIEPDDREDDSQEYIPPLLPSESEEDYDWHDEEEYDHMILEGEGE
jgi:hypothetical protein